MLIPSLPPRPSPPQAQAVSARALSMATLDDRPEPKTAAAMDVDQQEEEEEETDEMQLIEAMMEVEPAKAITKLQAIVAEPLSTENVDESIKRREHAITHLGAALAKERRTDELAKLIDDVKPFLKTVSKAKGSKLFRNLINSFLSLPDEKARQVEVCQQCIEWCKTENRRFLRQSLEIRLIQLYNDTRSYQAALALVQPLVSELKRLDDKSQLVQVQLIESEAYYALSNYPKSRAALVSAKTSANAIYCPPKMQAALDMQSGILHAQEGDFKTGYSYFYEAFEGNDSVDATDKAVAALKYMLLCKIMLNNASDIPSIISGKLALRYAGRGLDAMHAVGKASTTRSLAAFETALTEFPEELNNDVIIRSHLKEMKESMLQQNLARIVEPFSRVEIDHVAKLIDLPRDVVEKQLSQMILDKKLTGILDQGAGCLEIFDDVGADKTYDAALETIKQTEKVVDALYERAQQLF